MYLLYPIFLDKQTKKKCGSIAGAYEVLVLSPFMCSFYITAVITQTVITDYSWEGSHTFCMISGLNNNKKSLFESSESIRSNN